MEQNINIEISEANNRGKEQINVNKKYKYNLTLKKDNSKVYRCIE